MTLEGPRYSSGYDTEEIVGGTFLSLQSRILHILLLHQIEFDCQHTVGRMSLNHFVMHGIPHGVMGTRLAPTIFLA